MSNDDNNKMNMNIEEKANVLFWVQRKKQKKEREKCVKVSINNGIPIVLDIHEPCYCGKLVTRGALCHEPCYCGKLVTRGDRICHERCYCGKLVTRGVLCHTSRVIVEH